VLSLDKGSRGGDGFARFACGLEARRRYLQVDLLKKLNCNLILGGHTHTIIVWEIV
jgi:hypothetical protein